MEKYQDIDASFHFWKLIYEIYIGQSATKKLAFINRLLIFRKKIDHF